MTTLPLLPARLLDARPADSAREKPIADAVNIPLDELPRRTHELPPRATTTLVADVEPGPAAARWLADNGRNATLKSDWSYAPPDPHTGPRRLWQPADFVAQTAVRLHPGRALDLACGSGRDAVFLAASGWIVQAVDRLPDALQRGRDLETRCRRAIAHPITWHRADLHYIEKIDNPAFLQSGGFDLILIMRFLHRPLLRRVAAWLRPGGNLLIETFTTLHRARHGKPARDEHLLMPGELPTLLHNLEIHVCDEAWRGDLHTARAWATRT